MKDRSHEEAMVELFRDDPQFAADYLTALLQDGEPADLLVALRQIADAHGGVRAVAKETALNANQLYRTLSAQGNPELRSLFVVLKALGLRLAIQPDAQHFQRPRRSAASAPIRTNIPAR
jgi:probable addiction module antidote protein